MDYESLDVYSTTLRYTSLASEALGASWCFSIPKPDGWCSRWEARMVLAPKWTTWSWKERKAWHRQVVSPNRCTHLFCICFVWNHSIYIYTYTRYIHIETTEARWCQIWFMTQDVCKNALEIMLLVSAFGLGNFRLRHIKIRLNNSENTKKGGPNVL